MQNTFGIWEVDPKTQYRFRILCIAKGITAHKLFKEMVDNAWESDKTVPSKSGTKMIKRIVKKAFYREVVV